MWGKTTCCEGVRVVGNRLARTAPQPRNTPLPRTSRYAFSGCLPELCCEAHLAVIIGTCFAVHLYWLVSRTLRISKVANWVGTMARALTLDTISVGNSPVYILLIPSVGPNVWMLKLVMVIAEDRPCKYLVFCHDLGVRHSSCYTDD